MLWWVFMDNSQIIPNYMANSYNDGKASKIQSPDSLDYLWTADISLHL